MKLQKVCTAFFVISAICFFGCKNEKTQPVVEETIEEDASPSGFKILSEKAKERIDGKKAAIVLGYGFNDEDSVSSIKSRLGEEFGGIESEDESPVKIFIFPDDFMKGSKPRISLLSSFVENLPLFGIITLGAPEGTHRAIAAMKDKTESGSLDIPIIALFSQDDILAEEEAADLVIDYNHGENSLSENALMENSENPAEKSKIPNFSAGDVLVRAVQEMAETDGEIPKNSNLAELVSKILGNREIKPYLDSETKIQAVNHFVFD